MRIHHYLEQLCLFHSGHPVIPARQDRDVTTVFNELLAVMDESYFEHGRRQLRIQTKLLQLLETLSLNPEETSQATRSAMRKQTPYIQEILSFLEQNYSHNLTAETIAKFTGLERSYCSWLFSKAMGKPLMKYLTDLRMEKAALLLRSTNLTIQSVAESVGYNDPAVFSKSFKKSMGLAPTQLRKNPPPSQEDFTMNSVSTIISPHHCDQETLIETPVQGSTSCHLGIHVNTDENKFAHQR